MQKITPFLWFDDNAEEAVNHYISLFKDSKVLGASRYGDEGPGPKGQVMVITFQLAGQQFMALNGGPHFKFTEAISLVVDCATQEELDALCDGLISGGGELSRCGWLKDRYGLSWQLVPTVFGEMMQDGDPARRRRVMEAMMQMRKLDIARLKRAYAGEAV